MATSEPLWVGLQVPDRHRPDSGSFDCRPRAVEDWLQNLPVTNLGETSRQVYEALQDLNRLELRPARRLVVLERVREMVDYLVESLRKLYCGRELPLQEKPRRAANVAQHLLSEIALGYEVILHSAVREGRLATRRTLALALERTVDYRGRMFLESWLVYRPGPSDGWRRLHSLYRIGEAQNLSGARVPSGGERRRGRWTPLTAYKRILLTAAVGPLRLRPQEIMDSYRLLGQWAAHAQLVAPDAAQAGEGAFQVRVDGNQPPRPAGLEEPQSGDRVLVTTDMVSVMEREFATTTVSRAFWRRRPLADVSPDLARRLIVALGAVSSRRQARLNTRSRVQVVVGMVRIHQMLCRELGWDEDAEERYNSQFRSRETAAEAGRGGPDVWDLIYPTELIRTLELEAQQRNRVDAREARESRPLDWDLLNVSAGGYCLLSDPDQSRRIQVGELIAMRDAAGRSQVWQLGVVRWLRTPEPERLQVGVELLGPRPIPVQARTRREDGGFGPDERALLLPAVVSTERPASVVIPGDQLEPGGRARIGDRGKETDIEILGALDRTSHFGQFEFRRCDALQSEPLNPPR